MNINVIVLNIHHGLQPSNLRNWDRGRHEDFSRTSVKPESHVPVEEVIELTPENGVWVGEKGVRHGRSIVRGDQDTGRKSISFSAAATYDQNGRLRRSIQAKGLRIDVLA